nr:MAG TPA: hypothetical protein [Bacteriophage sp.]
MGQGSVCRRADTGHAEMRSVCGDRPGREDGKRAKTADFCPLSGDGFI